MSYEHQMEIIANQTTKPKNGGKEEIFRPSHYGGSRSDWKKKVKFLEKPVHHYCHLIALGTFAPNLFDKAED